MHRKNVNQSGKVHMVMLRLIMYLVIGYSAICITLFLVQHRMIYFPDPKTPAKGLLQTLELQIWPTEGPVHRGLIGTRQGIGTEGTVVVFHGNAGCAKDRVFYCQALESLGYRVVLAEYPGYGGRPGKLSEQVFLEDAITTVSMVYEKYGSPVFLCGESLGCGVAAGVSVKSTIPIEGMILITPWDSLPDLAQSIYRFFPARLLVRDKYDNINNLKEFQGGVVVTLAEHDEVIPKKHGMRLYNSLTCDKKLWLWKGAGHNSWPGFINVSWWKEAMGFIDRN